MRSWGAILFKTDIIALIAVASYASAMLFLNGMHSEFFFYYLSFLLIYASGRAQTCEEKNRQELLSENA